MKQKEKTWVIMVIMFNLFSGVDFREYKHSEKCVLKWIRKTFVLLNIEFHCISIFEISIFKNKNKYLWLDLFQIMISKGTTFITNRFEFPIISKTVIYHVAYQNVDTEPFSILILMMKLSIIFMKSWSMS